MENNYEGGVRDCGLTCHLLKPFVINDFNQSKCDHGLATHHLASWQKRRNFFQLV